MAALDISTFTPMLKRYYTPRRVELITYKNFPTLRLLKKREDWTGDQYVMPIWHESAQAVGHVFATAQGNKGTGQYARWLLDQSKIYGFASIERQAMKRSMGDARAFMRAFTAEVDGVLQQLGREMAHKIFRSRNGSRGTISAAANVGGVDSTVTLSNRQNVVMFSVGMKVVFTSDGTASGALGGLAARTIDEINRETGVLTFRGELLVAGVGAGSHLHRHGDITTSSDTLGIAGFNDWLPTTAPGAALFFNVNRSVDTEKLGGIRVDGSGMTVEDALIEGSMRAFEAGAQLDHYVMNPLKFGHLIREAGSKLVRDDAASQRLGVTTYVVSTPAGEQRAFADPFCQPDRIYGLQADTWELVSSGPLPEIFDDDLRMLRESAEDAYEVRMGGYGQLGCHVPGKNIVIHSL